MFRVWSNVTRRKGEEGGLLKQSNGVTEAPSVHRATEFVCQSYSQFIYKAFIPKEFSRICTLYLRRSLYRRHLRNVALSPSPPWLRVPYNIRILLYHSIFRKNLFILLNAWENDFTLNTKSLAICFLTTKYLLKPLNLLYIISLFICPKWL